MYKYFKYFFDFVIALLILLFILPLVGVFVIPLLFISNKGKVFFIQERVGYKGKVFKILKLKTMTDMRNKEGELLPDDERLTLIGSIVRKLSLDEIPQMINVLKGEMSLIGPRPLLKEYLPLYNDFQRRRHEVKPGITGWTAVNGRNALTWEEKFRLDVYYVDHISFGLDFKILIKTILKVLKREGISDGVSQTMEKFKGNKV